VSPASLFFMKTTAHDIHVFCSQGDDYPQFKTSVHMKFANIDQYVKKVSKERLMLYITKTLKEYNISDIFILTGLN
jgi:hypothetical protein